MRLREEEASRKEEKVRRLEQEKQWILTTSSLCVYQIGAEVKMRNVAIRKKESEVLHKEIEAQKREAEAQTRKAEGHRRQKPMQGASLRERCTSSRGEGVCYR